MQLTQSTLPIGAVVQGCYIVAGLLGQGGFGAFYLVKDRRVTHNLFALKELIDSNKHERDRFGPTVTPTTPVPVVPAIAGSYKGAIHNTPADVNSTMSLPNIKQLGKNITGRLTLGPGLIGDRPFTGTVDAARHIQFTVPGVFGNASLLFYGIVQSNGSLRGNYCSLDQVGHCNQLAGGYGTWNATPAPQQSLLNSALESTYPYMLYCTFT